MNNKILTFVLLIGIASTGFAGISAANSGTTLWSGWTEIGHSSEKSKKSLSNFWKRKGLKNLTDEEKLALESMSDDEKKAFFTAKKEEMKAEKEQKKMIIDKLIAGESLTAAEELIRLELLAELESRLDEGKKTKPGAEIIVKILAGDELMADEQLELQEMQAKHAEREERRAIIEPILEKKKAGEELTSEEQTILDEMKANKKSKKEKGERKGER